MNNERRGQIIGVRLVLENIKQQLELIKEEEDKALINIPENLHHKTKIFREGEKSWEKLEDAITAVDTAIISMKEAVEKEV